MPREITHIVEGRALAVGLAATLVEHNVAFQFEREDEEPYHYYKFVVPRRLKRRFDKLKNHR